MKIVFVKFYERTVEGVKEHLALGQGVQPGKAVLIKPDSFAVVNVPPDLATLAWTELTREQWLATGEPISITINWANEPPEAPAKRELTPEEVIIDREYKAKLYGLRANRMERIREALADATHDLVAIETTVTTTTIYNSVPLMNALAQFLAPDPDPVDPIAWRRSAGSINKVSLVTAIVEALGPVVSSIIGGRTSAPAKPAAAPAPAKSEPQS